MVHYILPEIFMRYYFSEALHMQSFIKIKSSQNGVITLSFTDEFKSCHVANFYIANMSFNAIHENKILTKISYLTVSRPYCIGFFGFREDFVTRTV